jgi:hypothetical protein
MILIINNDIRVIFKVSKIKKDEMQKQAYEIDDLKFFRLDEPLQQNKMNDYIHKPFLNEMNQK